MAAVSPEHFESRRVVDPRRAQIRRRRSLVASVCVLGVVGAVAAGIAKLREQPAVDPGAVASPVSASALDLGARPPDRVIARAGLVDIHLPVDRRRVAFTLFRPVDDDDAIALTPDPTWPFSVAPREGRTGPERAGLDLAAPPEAIVYAPVDGTIRSVTPYVVSGIEAGYQVDISPETRSDVIVRVRHIAEIPITRRAGDVCEGRAGLTQPNVGEFVRAGITCIGQVRDAADLAAVARPEIAKYVSGAGNHVHMEVLRVSG